MPSPRWCVAHEVPIADAIAAAVHDAWDGPEEGASVRMVETLRKLVGYEVLERVQVLALQLLRAQPRPPAGYEMPPAWAFFTICPRCQLLRQTRFTAAQNGRLKLEVLRDPEWLERQFEKGRSCREVAERLKCSPSLVVDWAAKHELQPPRTMGAREFDERVRELHLQKEGPGTIASKLETSVQHVRQSLLRQGLATKKTGHVYFDREWWRARLEDQRLKLTECARQAGIRKHNATYYVNLFGFQHITRENARRGRGRKYPQLHDEKELRALLERHEDVYESAAKELGCAQSLVSRAARKLLGRDAKWQRVPHGYRSWWESRVERGDTTYEMAAEAGIEEKSAKEKLRVLGLLARAYHNNTARERKNRKRSA